MNKAEFARRVGLTRARISQLVKQGLPTTDDGMVIYAEAVEWMDKTLHPARRKGVQDPDPLSKGVDDTDTLADARLEHERVKIDRARLALARESGELVDKREAARAITYRARAERDRHLSWIAAASPEIAGRLGVDPGDLFRLLDASFRDHLAHLSESLDLEETGNE